MSTFLELVNLARSEAGVAGSDLTTLTGTLNQESTRFKNWVLYEWKRLQARHPDWQFLRTSFQFNTVASQASYTPVQAQATTDGTSSTASILADWKLDSFRISTSGTSFADEVLLGFMTWEQYRNLYQYGYMRSARSRPVVFTQDPTKNIYLGITPDSIYTVNGEFYRTPQILSADTDVPLMPAKYHDLIAFKALRAYGIFMSAPEVIGRADENISVLYPTLCSDQLPTMMSGAPLA
jgi:hypothetical protein